MSRIVTPKPDDRTPVMIQHGQQGKDQLPLLGVVLCWTSIPPEQRSAMVAVAQEMGASHKLDLMSDTTHLVVGNIDTPKYKYVARERQDIKVLKASWLDAVRETWLSGGETNVTALEEEHRLPTFYGLRICVTGFEDYTERTGLQDSINGNGATYHGDLTKAVTHLVAAEPRGKKYEYARAWGIKTVGIEWIRDSLERGMALEGELYDASLPAERRGIGAILRKPVPSPPPILGKRTRSDCSRPSSGEAAQRKLRRTASMRLGSQSGNLWDDIGGAGHMPTPESESIEVKKETEGAVKKTLESENKDEQEHSPGPEDKADSGFLQPPGFSGYFICGFDDQKTSVLKQYLESNRAHVHTTEAMSARDTTTPTIFVIPHNASSNDIRPHLSALNFSDELDELITEIWIEKCLFSKAFIQPDLHPLYQPFIASPTPGAAYDETLRRTTSVLVCNEDMVVNTEKLRYALENKIPVVSARWLWECMRTQNHLPYDDYAISGSRQTQNSTQPVFFHPKDNPRIDPKKNKQASFRSSGGPARSRSQRQGQLDLSIEIKQEALAALAPAVTTGPFQMDGQDEGVIQEMSPLRELSRSQRNSPKKRKAELSGKPTPDIENLRSSFEAQAEIKPDENTTEGQDTVAEATDTASIPAEKTLRPVKSISRIQDDALNSALATLQAHQKKATASRPPSASADVPQSDNIRRLRPLGRAPSNSFNSFSRQNSLDIDPNSPDISRRRSIVVEDDFDGLSTQARQAQEESSKNIQPSQSLAYEDPEGAALREKLLMKRGGGGSSAPEGIWNDDDIQGSGMKRVEGIGRVTDSRIHNEGTEEKMRRRAARRKVVEEL